MSEISDLFAKDPLLLTKVDRSAIIAKYREDRAKYFLGTGKLSATEKKALSGPKKKKSIADLEIL